MQINKFLLNYFPLLLLTIIILIAIMVFISVTGLNFKRAKNQKVTKRVTFAAGV